MDSHCGLSCFALVSITIRNRLREGGIVSEAVSQYGLSFIYLFLLSIMQGDHRNILG